MALIKINVSNSDPVTGKKIKATLSGINFNLNGQVKHCTYIISFHEVNDSETSPSGTNQQRRAVSSYEERFDIENKAILSTTKIYSQLFESDGVTPIANAINLVSYLELKAINSFPGVANADPSWNAIQGIFKEIISIRQVNGELPI